MLRTTEGKRRRGRQRTRWLDSITDSMDMDLVKLQEIAKERKAQSAAVRGSQTVRHDLMTEQQKWQWDFGRVAAWQDGRKYFWSNWQPSCPCGKTPRRRKKEPTAHTQYSGKISVMLLESTESAEGLSTLGLLYYKRYRVFLLFFFSSWSELRKDPVQLQAEEFWIILPQE